MDAEGLGNVLQRMVRREFVVRVHEADDVARCGTDAFVQGVVNALVRLANELGKMRTARCQYAQRSVGRAAIHHDVFDMPPGLGLHRPQASAERGRAVLDGCDDRYL